MSDRLELLRQVCEERPDDPFPRYGLAMELRRLGQLDQALAAFEALREASPTYLPQYLMAGQLCEQRDDEAGARAAYEAGMALAEAQGDDHALEELEAALDAL